MREQAGISLAAAAPKLDKTKSSLNRVETGKTRADVHLVRSMMDLYDQYDPTLLDLAREAAKKDWWVKYGIDDRGFLGMETEAATEWEWSLAYIPGLLQTKDYMRALFAANLATIAGTKRGDQVAARLHRQQRLIDDEFPLELTAIIDEAALRREVGGVDVMREQLAHLARQAELSTVSLQVLPSRSGAHVGMDSSFLLMGFPEPDDPEMLYLSYVTGALHIEKPEEVSAARLAFSHLRSEALSPRDSVAFVQQVRDEL